MPDDRTIEDTIIEDAPGPTDESASTAPDKDTAEEEKQLFFGKYDSIEKAEQAWVERDKQYGKLTNEVGELRKTAEMLKAQADQAGAIRELVETLKPKQQAPDGNAYQQTLAEKYGEDQAGMAAEILQTTSSWYEQDRKRLEAQIAEREKSLHERIESLSAAQIKLTPEYLQNRDMVDDLTKGGMTLSAAIEFAQKISGTLPPKAPNRIQPPGGIGGDRSAPHEKPPQKYWTDEERARYKDEYGLTDEDLDAREAEVLAAAGGGA